MPVAVVEPVTRFVGKVLADKVHEQMPQPVVAWAYGCSQDDRFLKTPPAIPQTTVPRLVVAHPPFQRAPRSLHTTGKTARYLVAPPGVLPA